MSTDGVKETTNLCYIFLSLSPFLPPNSLETENAYSLLLCSDPFCCHISLGKMFVSLGYIRTPIRVTVNIRTRRKEFVIRKSQQYKSNAKSLTNKTNENYQNLYFNACLMATLFFNHVSKKLVWLFLFAHLVRFTSQDLVNFVNKSYGRRIFEWKR